MNVKEVAVVKGCAGGCAKGKQGNAGNAMANIIDLFGKKA